MPIGKYAEWHACKADGKSDEYCGFLEHHAGPKQQEDHYMGRNMDPTFLNQIYRRYLELQNKGIPDIEIQRAIMSEFAYGSHWNDPWPPRIVGVDIVDRIYPELVPATKYPPYEGITNSGDISGMDLPERLPILEEVSIPGSLSQIKIGEDKTSPQWLGTASTTIGGPSMHGEDAAINQRRTPEESWYPWGDNACQYCGLLDSDHDTFIGHPFSPTVIAEAYVPYWVRYKYNGHEMSEYCKTFNGMIFDMNKSDGRPILPSENLGYTTQHPNCRCTWEVVDPILAQDVEPSDMLGHQKDHISKVNRIIGQKSRHGTLHALNSDGSVSDSTFDVNPRKLMETVGELHQQFRWLTPSYMNKLSQLRAKMPGKFYLVRAAAETTTDHRIEGEPYQRKLGGMELVKMARTGVGKKADINHMPELVTDTIVMDGEGDEARNEIQFLVHVSDPEIIKYIDNHSINAVSINGGAPRETLIGPCDHTCTATECEVCSHPVGVILGEMDGIAFTWVVTNPQGIVWKGMKIPPAEPGVKVTKIESL